MKVSNWVRIWLYIGLILVFFQIVIGGITRLTGSGLSITKWDIVTGTIPPMNEKSWEEAFDLYKATPQYQKINEGMRMEQFKFIFFWEYFHRLWARSMGFIFLIPFLFFYFKKMLPRGVIKRLGLVVALAALAASFGWIMVASGLIHRPWVNAYKLTLHLAIGISVFISMLWTVFYVEIKDFRIIDNAVIKQVKLLISLLIIQILLGGIMSGMKAGLFYPTWPDMNGEIIPHILFNNSHWNVESFVNYDETAFTSALVQFLHRTVAYIAFIYGLIFSIGLLRKNLGKFATPPVYIFILLLFSQVVLGILTVINCKGSIPLAYGVLHQAFGILLLSSAFYFLYVFTKSAKIVNKL